MSGSEEIARLEHWIYGATPERGYGTRAESYNVSPQLYIRHLAGHLTPVRVEKTTEGGAVIDARMVHPVIPTDEVLLSLLGRGAADEYNRPTIANHTVIIPASLLRTGRLTLVQVERAAQDFDRTAPHAVGKVEPLVVPLLAPGEASARWGAGLRRLMTRAAAETLATRLMGDAHGRTLVLCRGSTNSHRVELLYEVVELLNCASGLPFFTSISDPPTLSSMNHFRLAISSRGVRADGSWMLLDASLEKPALSALRSKWPIYARIAQAYGQDPYTVGAVAAATT